VSNATATPAGGSKVALVLAGGGARGAYELGVLSVLLPVLERRGERPDIIVGTSVGALNTAFLAATAHKEAAAVVEEGTRIWDEVRYEDVLRPIVSAEEVGRAVVSLAELIGVPGVRLWNLLDPAPLAATLRRLIAFAQIRRNVASGALTAAAVVATATASGRSVVFHEGGGALKTDTVRGIEYVRTAIGVEHVRASAAIPSLFPAVRVEKPRGARGWYVDGGVRLNTPIKPALLLGAERVIVIALNSLAPPAMEPARARPDVYDGVGQFLQALLVDPVVHDVNTLAMVNEIVDPDRPSSRGRGKRPYRRVPYILVAPATRESVGERAMRVYREHYAGLGAAVRSRNVALLGHALDAGLNPQRGELFSYLFFAPEFARELMELGAADTKRWLSRRHDDGPWRLRPLPAAG
jgi:NTE family protein